MKVFISQPMQGLTDEEILQTRERAIAYAKAILPHPKDEEIEIIDSFFQGATLENRPLWFLGKSLQLLSTADYCLFIGDWAKSRGCKIEHECCVQYGIRTIYF